MQINRKYCINAAIVQKLLKVCFLEQNKPSLHKSTTVLICSHSHDVLCIFDLHSHTIAVEWYYCEWEMVVVAGDLRQ